MRNLVKFSFLYTAKTRKIRPNMTDEYFMFLAVIIWSVEPLCQCLLVCPTKKKKKVKQKSSSEDELENRPDTKFGRGKSTRSAPFIFISFSPVFYLLSVTRVLLR